MKPFKIFTILFLGLACNPSKKEVNTTLENNTKNSEKTYSNSLSVPADTLSIKSPLTGKYSLTDIQGAWGENLDENAYYLIKGDSAYYIEGEIIPIAISNDSLIFYYPNLPMSFKINWIRGDSMSLRTNNESEVLVRRNK